MKRKINAILIMLAIFFPVSEIWKQVVLYRFNGYYDFWYFPFQLCSMPIYLLPAYLLLKDGKLKEDVGNFLMCYGLLGGIAVFLDTSGLHYQINALTVHSYLWHVLMITVSLLLYRLNKLKERHLYGATAIYIICCMIATILNCTLYKYGSINMFYISPHQKMYQIVFKDIAKLTGETAIIFIYIISTILAAEAIYQLLKRLKSTGK